MRFAFVAVTFSLLAACMPTPTPEQRADRAQKIEAQQTSNRNLAAQEFGPLIPLCIAAIERNAVPTAAQMAALGFPSKMVVAYVKPRGTRTIDRINGVNTTFSAKPGTCTLGLGNYVGVQQAGVWVRDDLVRRGYTMDAAQSRRGFALSKGGVQVLVTGVSVSAATSISISRR